MVCLKNTRLELFTIQYDLGRSVSSELQICTLLNLSCLLLTMEYLSAIEYKLLNTSWHLKNIYQYIIQIIILGRKIELTVRQR